MRVEGLAVLARRLERLEATRCIVAHRHDLERHDVHVGARRRAEVIRDAQPLAAVLAGKVESRLLHERAVARVRLGVVHHEIVVHALHGEIAVHRARLQPPVGHHLLPESRERRLKYLLHHPVELRSRAAAAPLEPVQLVEVEQVEHFVHGNVVEHSSAPEGWDGNRVVLRDVAALTGVAPALHVLADVRAQERVLAGVLEQLRDCFLATLGRVLQRVHRLQPLEGVLAVKHARLVRALRLHEHRAPPEAAVDCRTANEHWNLDAALVELLHAQRHLLARAYEQRREADRIRANLERLLDDRVHRHLLAEVEHGVAVVGENRVDERLPDVVHVAVHGGEHHLALGIALRPLEEGLEMLHRLLHHFSALQHEGKNELAGAELVADLLHGGEQHFVEHADRLRAHSRRVERVLDPLFLAVQHHPVDFLLRRHPHGGIFLLRARVLLLGGRKPFDEALECVGALVEHQIVGQRALLGADLRVGGDVRRVHDRRVEARFHAMVQEHRVEHVARDRIESEAHIGHAKDREHAGQFALDETNALDGLVRAVDPLHVAGGECKGERVVDQVLGAQSVLADDDVVDRFGDFELSLAGLRHPDGIDRERDQCRAMLLRERHDVVDALAAILHVDGVDDRAPGHVLECRLDHRSLGAIDHERRLDTHGKQLDHLRHLFRFVAALGERDADVEHVRAALLLLARHFEDALVVVGQQQALHLARALRIHALAHEQRCRLLPQRGGTHRRGDERFAMVVRQCRRRCPPHGRDDGRKMLRRRAAAPAHDPHAELLDELAQHPRHRKRLEGIDRLARSRVQRQTGIGNHRNRQ